MEKRKLKKNKQKISVWATQKLMKRLKLKTPSIKWAMIIPVWQTPCSIYKGQKIHQMDHPWGLDTDYFLRGITLQSIYFYTCLHGTILPPLCFKVKAFFLRNGATLLNMRSNGGGKRSQKGTDGHQRFTQLLGKAPRDRQATWASRQRAKSMPESAWYLLSMLPIFGIVCELHFSWVTEGHLHNDLFLTAHLRDGPTERRKVYSNCGL